MRSPCTSIRFVTRETDLKLVKTVWYLPKSYTPPFMHKILRVGSSGFIVGVGVDSFGRIN